MSARANGTNVCAICVRQAGDFIMRSPILCRDYYNMLYGTFERISHLHLARVFYTEHSFRYFVCVCVCVYIEYNIKQRPRMSHINTLKSFMLRMRARGGAVSRRCQHCLDAACVAAAYCPIDDGVFILFRVQRALLCVAFALAAEPTVGWLVDVHACAYADVCVCVCVPA